MSHFDSTGINSKSSNKADEVSNQSSTLNDPSYIPQYALSLTLPLSLIQVSSADSYFIPNTSHHCQATRFTEDEPFQRDTVLRSAPTTSNVLLTMHRTMPSSQETPDKSEVEEVECNIKIRDATESRRLSKRANEGTHGVFKKPKVVLLGEASDMPSTSNFTEANNIEKRNPPCAICGDSATGIHFGADSCAACSAFFRRTVTMNRRFECVGNSPSNCSVSKGTSTCKKCRFDKCLSVGMEISSVQCNRDSIGHYSRMARMLQSSNSCPGRSDNLLDDLMDKYNALNYRRQLLYSMEDNIDKIFHRKEPALREMQSITECLYQVKLLEPRLAADFVRSLQFVKDAQLSVKDLLLLYKNFNIARQAVEEPFLTYECKMLDRNCWVMLNRTYIDLSNTRRYFENGTMNELTLNRITAENLFIPSLQNAIANVSMRMKKSEVTFTEFIAMYGIALFDSGVDSLSCEARKKMLVARGSISKSLLKHYEESGLTNPEVELGALYMDVYTYSKVHAITTAENMHLLDIFNIVPSVKECAMDKCLQLDDTQQQSLI
ncbi:unnamed protein product [Cylicocyclus nassatus]|uniref:Uncharacterized protein n=1 Tax=Cylicocyclus nassatus TaxID=53992 RepID=A0AA36MAJ7_CYLNA|nr:unnamed protein product [Cylicocyclus nassatus]